MRDSVYSSNHHYHVLSEYFGVFLCPSALSQLPFLIRSYNKSTYHSWMLWNIWWSMRVICDAKLDGV